VLTTTIRKNNKKGEGLTLCVGPFSFVTDDRFDKISRRKEKEGASMISIHNELLNGEIPILNIAKQETFDDGLPTMIFLHGITSSKEQNLAYGYLLAEAGYRTLLPDFPMHGERSTEHSDTELQFQFWDIVLQGIAELKVIVEHFVGTGQIDRNRIGVAGTSMGAITMFGALSQYDWIHTAVSLMGTPCYEQFAAYLIEGVRKNGVELPFTDAELQEKVTGLRPFDLSQEPGRIGKCPLLIWHGEKDPVIPYPLTKDFYDRLKEDGSADPSQIKMITDPLAGHKVPRYAVHATVKWFLKHL
jgi:fermentation-respiration switch protein FrsA (DUF1100 family)